MLTKFDIFIFMGINFPLNLIFAQKIYVKNGIVLFLIFLLTKACTSDNTGIIARILSQIIILHKLISAINIL